MWFAGWTRLGMTGATAIVSYVFLVGALRVSGKRTLAKLNAFDLVVTVALGSVLATVVVSRQVAVAEGLLALGVLVMLQFVVAWSTQRSGEARRAVTAAPTALVDRGQPQSDAMRRCRVTVDEAAAAVRQHGAGSFAQIDLVILETDGSLTVVPDRGDGSALRGVEGVR